MEQSKVIAYIAVVDALAVAAFVCCGWSEVLEHSGTVLLLALLAALGGSRPVLVPRLRTEVTASDAFSLCALGAFGAAAGGCVAFASVVGAALGERRRPSAVRLTFNLGAVPLAMLCAGAVFWAAGGRPGAPTVGSIAALAAAGLVYFVINTGLVAGAITLARKERFRAAWQRSLVWTGVASITGISVAALLVYVLERLGPWALLLGVPPAWILTVFFRTNRDTIVERDDRIESVETQNAELERKVQERTQKLQEVLSHIEAMNRQLRESNERLVEAGRIKSEFLANVSHELRTPLNAVIGFSDLLADPANGSLSESQREFLADIHDSGEHLLNLINNILDLSKIEAGRLELKRTAIDVPELLRTAVAMLRTQAIAKEIRIGLEVEEGIARAQLDEGMVREVVVNLLSNAVKFTPPGGEVEVVARRNDRELVVEVRDTGIGIRPDDHEKIFDAFYQVDGSYSRTYQGTGLGLALVARLVALHDGRVTVRSELGAGASFTCTFPSCFEEARFQPAVLPRAAEAIVAPPAPAPPADPGRRTILLVEDNDLNRKLARNALRSRGYEVIEVVSGEEAVAFVHSRRPDLVLMDLQLPGMDGLEATRRIKQDPANADLPVIALTAHVQALDEARARAAGCEGYITKPIRLTAFPGQVELYLDRVEVPA